MTPRGIALIVVAWCMLAMAATMEAAELSGSWKGALIGSDGKSGEVQVDFGLQGLHHHPLHAAPRRHVFHRLPNVGQFDLPHHSFIVGVGVKGKSLGTKIDLDFA